MKLQDFLDKAADGRIFTVSFVKRSTGEERVMNCRTGVTKGTQGKSMGYDPAAKALLSVYDVQKQGFRVINLADLLWLKMGGQEYTWDIGRAAFVAKKDRSH